ncbi:tRNA modification GTPase [Thermotomaculum hydrothermale]|uniref:tRNA modification GTPase MnmE n=1 Tax=Thermotomaculum hydrothermale TaxID=981385 RepID=A0A7R6T092_9BACT|nr:tRNA uridine-5-carboxymethylaminomethyl(34) synthesis GTPase MnmE [Thermotomaculum hydrothermale]BBB33482.1 tRNA modification GTPase [Thermotomaculum hydrothermale]
MKNTIVAIATPPGKGGVGIVRVSGENSLKIAKRFFSPVPDNLEHSRMYFGKFKGEVEDTGYLVYFKSPKSYTGEDTVEFHLHGSPYILYSVVSSIINSGLARLAEPGEFTKRALFNGKINLIDAEAINTIISAENSYQAKVLSNLSGRLSDFVLNLKDNLIKSIAFLEASIEYPEEEETEDAVERAVPIVREALKSLENVLQVYEKSRFIFKGAKVVIAGKPNVGKSSLLNAIAGFERAIVTEIPGTTTDSIEVDIEYRGIKFSFVDTAGIREASGLVENLGIERTFKELEESDLILYLFDSSDKDFVLPDGFERFNSKIIKVLNKIDLFDIVEFNGLKISAKKKTGIDKLLDTVFDFFNKIDFSENFVFSERQYSSLKQAESVLLKFLDIAEDKVLPEVGVAVIGEAVEILESVIGEVTTDNILDSVFGNFCLGK